MKQAAAHPPTGDYLDRRPPDLEVMRESARQLLDPDSEPGGVPPSRAELETLTLKLRGHLELLAAEVEQAAVRHPEDEVLCYCALACVGEARGKLRASPLPGYNPGVAYARRIARVLNALCDHHENLSSRDT